MDDKEEDEVGGGHCDLTTECIRGKKDGAVFTCSRQIGEGQTDVILSTTTVTHPLCS